MSSEQLISELDSIIKKEDSYVFFNYINKNIGVFISAISIISAIVLFTARTICFLVVSAKYQFWNLDEGFIVEDNKEFLKLGVYVLLFVLLTALSSFAKRSIYGWELYNCEIYLLNKTISCQSGELKELKKRIRKSSKLAASIKRNKKKITKLSKSAASQKKNKAEIAELLASIERFNDSTNEDWLCETLQVKKEYTKLMKEYAAMKTAVWKIRISIFSKFFIVMLGVFVASIILLLFSGAENWNNGIASLVVSAAIISLLIMFTAFFCAFCEIKLPIKAVLKRSFKGKKIDWESDSIQTVIEWLEYRETEHKNQTIKVHFSDKSLKALSINVIVTTIILTIFLIFNVNYSLKHMDTFYVFSEDQQDYVMLINDGAKYIFSGCDINDNNLIIDTNKIIVRKDPVSLEKKQFKRVERKQ